MLPDILETLPVDNKRSVLAVLTLVCAADGELVREEMAALEAKMGQALMHPEVRREVRQMLRQPPDIETLILDMDETSLKLAVRDAVLIAAADGEYHLDEMKIIKKIADAAGLQSNTIEELINWVEELWMIQAKGRSLIGLSIPGDEKLLESS
ncbi:MAG: TerB family tellurite resistance protein [Candidatus Poseidoniaceae archaeon]|mgnify:FL=1|nr:TerB family tellurite resistance protein [Candidatus Poseidoniaceae archaeon]MDP7312210.1 TerB family tellurite resistance protein [Candidatus Thalassarchaeaceae archaeon]